MVALLISFGGDFKTGMNLSFPHLGLYCGRFWRHQLQSWRATSRRPCERRDGLVGRSEAVSPARGKNLASAEPRSYPRVSGGLSGWMYDGFVLHDSETFSPLPIYSAFEKEFVSHGVQYFFAR
jgi:hypothetical protein